LGVARWADDPAHLFRAVQGYLRLPSDAETPDAQFARGAREAEAMAAELLGRVHGPRRRLLGALLRRVRANAGAREYPKFQVIRLFAKGRALLAPVGADLASRGFLSSADDVWYLTLAEMRRAVVDEALAVFYYPQQGKRSWGGNARYGITGRDNRVEYAAWWNSHGILCLQMETLTAVTHARQLAKPGVDCLTWGPSDLSFDLEAHPEHPFKTVDDCLRHVLKQLEGTDIRVSFRNYSPDLRQKYMDLGVTVFMERPRA